VARVTREDREREEARAAGHRGVDGELTCGRRRQDRRGIAEVRIGEMFLLQKNNIEEKWGTGVLVRGFVPDGSGRPTG
jgi:hypothetical protein